MMKQKIFIAGKVYDLSQEPVEKITKKLQKKIDRMTENEFEPGRNVHVSIQQGEAENIIEIHIKRNNILGNGGTNPETICDIDGLLVMGSYGTSFRPPVMWELVEPLGLGRYMIPLAEFIYAYSETAQKLGGDEVKAMNIESTDRMFIMRIVF